jgi:hypothetical protein
LNQITDLNSAQLAPVGTPLWQTDYHAFAPRFGTAYTLREVSGSETVVRGGFGLFYDMGNTLASGGFAGVGFGSFVLFPGVSFPLTSQQLVLPPASTASPYANAVHAFDPHLKLPYTMQWSFAVEQALGSSQALTVTYVGSSGRRLLFTSLLFPPTNPNFASGNGLFLTTGAASSEYDALQLQFQRKLSHGLQALASYTWSHSIDDGSTNFEFSTPQLLRASSDFDIRQNLQLALTYDVPGKYSNLLAAALLQHWGVDSRISARTALPVDVIEGFTTLSNGQSAILRPDLVSGFPVYLYGSQYAGGRILNFSAFKSTVAHTQGNVPRNFARGLGAAQADVALRRDFPINERLHLQFRAEAFNISNHPNFGRIQNNLRAGPFQPSTLSGFGGAQQTLNNSLHGLNALYQVGGPRSLQLMLKLAF